MICKKCASIFDDSLLACPSCGWSFGNDNAEITAPKRTEPFKLNINFDEEMPEYKGVDTAAAVNTQPTAVPFEMPEVTPPSYPGEEPSQPVARPVKRPAPKAPVKKNPVMNRAKAPAAQRPVKRTGVNKAVSMPKKSAAPKVNKAAPARQMSAEMLEQVKKSTNAIVILVCTLAVLMIGITVLGAKTDVFTEKDDTVKTVALSGDRKSTRLNSSHTS